MASRVLHYRFLERVGWLNVLDVMNPHTHFELDFKHLDHWKVGHVLTQLAATEEPLEKAAGFLRTLQRHAPSDVRVHVLACRVAVRKKK